MSNRPNPRQHRRRDDQRRRLAEVEADAPIVVFDCGKGRGELSQPIPVGDVLFLVPVPPEGASEELLAAFSVRATATVQGRCPLCGERRKGAARRHDVARAEFAHEDWCVAHDRAIGDRMRSEGFQ